MKEVRWWIWVVGLVAVLAVGAVVTVEVKANTEKASMEERAKKEAVEKQARLDAELAETKKQIAADALQKKIAIYVKTINDMEAAQTEFRAQHRAQRHRAISGLITLSTPGAVEAVKMTIEDGDKRFAEADQNTTNVILGHKAKLVELRKAQAEN